MTKKQPEQQEPDEKAPQKAQEKEFNKAVERIYRKYGTDLSAFRRDVQSQLAKRG